MDQKHIRNLPLDLLLDLTWDRQLPIIAAFLGKQHLSVMSTEIIADSIQRFYRNTEILFKGGKLPIYDHGDSLP